LDPEKLVELLELALGLELLLVPKFSVLLAGVRVVVVLELLQDVLLVLLVLLRELVEL
jgi:hypothetical protein